MKFIATCVALFSLTTVSLVAAQPDVVTEDHPLARYFAEEEFPGMTARDEDGVLYRRMQAGACNRRGECQVYSSNKTCKAKGCVKASAYGFPCAC